MLQEFTASFTGEALGVLVLAGLGLALWGSKSLAMKGVGVFFCGFAVLRAVGSPALLTVAGFAAALYIIYRVMKRRRDTVKRRQLCQRCGHPAHVVNSCQWAYCRC